MNIIEQLNILNLRRRWHMWARRQLGYRDGTISLRLMVLHTRLVEAMPLWSETNWTEPEFNDW